MRIKTRLLLNTYIALLATLLMVLILVWSFQASQSADRRAAAAVEIRKVAFQRLTARDEFLLTADHSALVRWRALSRSLRELLDRSAGFFAGPEHAATLAQIRAAFEATERLLPKIAATKGRPGPAGSVSAGAGAEEQLLIGEIIAKAYALVEAADRLGLATAAAAATARRREMWLLAGCLLAMVAIVVGNSLVLNFSLASGISRIAAGTRIIGGGDLEHRIRGVGDDELGDLARTTNDMAGRLRGSLAALEAANRELEAFSYSVSHDLRAPLRHLTGFVGLLEGRAGTALDEKSRHYLEVIAGAARQMGQLVDDLLSFSRMGRVELMKSRVSLAGVVREALEELRPGEPGREVALKVGNLPEVVGDAAMLKQVFLNLIGNALKYSGRRERAEVEVGTAPAADGEICCFVRDNGAGFDMKYVDKLFGLFQRLHHQDEFAGTGVGLANVKRIITRHGGRVWAEGTVDRGATFFFTLPAPQEDPA